METDIASIELRQDPNATRSYYIIYTPDGTRFSEFEAGARKALTLGYDVLLKYCHTSVTIDGVRYSRPIYSLPSTEFFTFKNDSTHLPDVEVRLDCEYEHRHICDHCKTDWMMNEELFLKYGYIHCAYCDRGGGGSAWSVW